MQGASAGVGGRPLAPLPAASMLSRPRLAPAAVAALAAASLVAACSDDSSSGPRTNMAPVASRYLDTAIAFTQEVSYWSEQVNWTQARTNIRAQTPTAQTTRATYPAIEYMLANVLGPRGDRHSGFWPKEDAPGLVDSPPDPFNRYLAQGQAVTLPGPARQAGYLWIPTFAGINEQGRTDSIVTVVRTVDQGANLCGWILDLRFNPGGYWSAMAAGLHPIIGEAPASSTQPGFMGFVDRDDARALLYLRNGTAGLYDPSDGRSYPYTTASSVYVPRRPGLPVAILQGRSTASAGEMLILAFKGSPTPSRTFGDSTYGVTNVPVGRYLSDSAYLNVTYAIMFDRTGKLWGDRIGPDERITAGAIATGSLRPQPSADDPVVNAARTWLAAQPACTGAGVAPGPAAARGPAPAVALPGVVKAPAEPLDRVSRHWGSRAAGALLGATPFGTR